MMSYNKTIWVNDETEVNAENMNHIENGIEDAYNVPLIAVSDTAPSECSTGDKYYNTEDNKIYTATGTNTWGEIGETPISDILYVVFEEKNTYAYNGITLVSVGGGSGSQIVVEPDEPTEDTKLFIEEEDLDFNGGIPEDIYSTDEIKTNKKWIDGKPIYRKVFHLVNIARGYQQYAHEISNLGVVINVYGSIYLGNTYQYNPIARVVPDNISGEGFGILNITNTYIHTLAGTSMLTTNDAYVILEYTKTTN